MSGNSSTPATPGSTRTGAGRDAGPGAISGAIPGTTTRAQNPSGIPFSKYHGLGNDYLVIDGRREIEGESAALSVSSAGTLTLAPTVTLTVTPAVTRRMCDRNLGVGSDGILLRGDDPEPGTFALRILNPDGSEAEKSGNGLRIFARALWDLGEVAAEPFTVRTAGGDVECRVGPDGQSVRVAMGKV